MDQKFTIKLSENHLAKLEQQWLDLNHLNTAETILDHPLSPVTSALRYRSLKTSEQMAHLKTTLSTDKTVCAICCTTINQDQRVYHLDCKHLFHHTCLESWFRISSNLECPLCRQSNLYNKPVNRIFYKERLVEQSTLLHTSNEPSQTDPATNAWNKG